MEEIWKGVEGFEDSFEISNMGRLRSLDRYITDKESTYRDHRTRFFRGQLMSLVDDGKGYAMGQVRKNNRVQVRRVHRLVAEAFLEKVVGKDEVNHIDGNKKNNRVDNLEWSNRSENNLHAFRIGLRKHAMGKENKYSKPVSQFDKNGNLIRSFESIRQTRESGFTICQVSECCRGNQKTHRGFVWSWAQK